MHPALRSRPRLIHRSQRVFVLLTVAAMNFLFKHKPRTPTDIARILKELCVRLGASESPDRTWTLVEPALSMDQKRKVRTWLLLTRSDS